MQSRVIYKSTFLAILIQMVASEAMQVKQAEEVCTKEADITNSDLMRLTDMSEDELKKFTPKLNKFSTCFYKKTEAIDDSGNFEVNKMVKIFGGEFDDADKVIGGCIKDAEAIKEAGERISSVDMCIIKNLKSANK